jgi:hypothetical protein
MKHILLIAVLLFANLSSFAQLSKMQFQDAEEAFSNGQYEQALYFLTQAEQTNGKTNPIIEHLKILSYWEIIKKDPLNDWDDIEILYNTIDSFLTNYANKDKIADRYREVYNLKQEAESLLPANEQAFENQIAAIKEKERLTAIEQARKEAEARRIAEEKEMHRKAAIAQKEQEWKAYTKKYNKLNFFNIGYYRGTESKHGVFVESGGYKTIVGVRASIDWRKIKSESSEKLYYAGYSIMSSHGQIPDVVSYLNMSGGLTFRLFPFLHFYTQVGVNDYYGYYRADFKNFNTGEERNGVLISLKYQNPEYVDFIANIGFIIRPTRWMSLNVGYVTKTTKFEFQQITFGLGINFLTKY